MAMVFAEGFISHFARLFASQMQGIPVAGLVLFVLGSSAAVFAAGAVYARVRGVCIPLRWRLLACLMLFYACFLLMITLFNREPGSRGGVFTDLLSYIATGHITDTQQFIYSALNWLLFLPWGVLLAFLWEQSPAPKRVVMATLCCFVTSCAIECLQLATARGYFELEDILMNTLGGLAGAVLISIPLYLARKAGDAAAGSRG